MPQKTNRLEQQVVEIQGVGPPEMLLVPFKGDRQTLRLRILRILVDSSGVCRSFLALLIREIADGWHELVIQAKLA